MDRQPVLQQSQPESKSNQSADVLPLDFAVERMSLFAGDGSLRALCNLVVAGSVLVTGIRVVEGQKGLFVSMPREQGKDGNWYDTVVPLTKEARRQISDLVLAAYKSGAPPASSEKRGR